MANDIGSPIQAGVSGWSAPRNIHSLGIPVKATTDGNDTTPAVTETFIAEVSINKPSLVTGFAVFNGSAVAGNMVVILYNKNGRVITKSASTAQAGTDALQRVPFAAAQKLKEGDYYVGIQFNNTGARLNTHTVGNGGTLKTTGGTYNTAITITPPTTFTANVGPMGALY